PTRGFEIADFSRVPAKVGDCSGGWSLDGIRGPSRSVRNCFLPSQVHQSAGLGPPTPKGPHHCRPYVPWRGGRRGVRAGRAEYRSPLLAPTKAWSRTRRDGEYFRRDLPPDEAPEEL